MQRKYDKVNNCLASPATMLFPNFLKLRSEQEDENNSREMYATFNFGVGFASSVSH
jgi:phosphoribosylaminoimidazole (AIR) synthetase